MGHLNFFEKTSHHSGCPHKGEASYFSLDVQGMKGENLVWSYETPKADVAAIKEHLAFYPNKGITIEEV